MSEKSKIAWTDSTLNFWEGCTKVSAGCQHCYAEARDKRFTGGKLWGKGAARRKSKSAVKDAFKFNRFPWVCDKCGTVALATTSCDKPVQCSAPHTKIDKHGNLGNYVPLEKRCACKSFHRRRIFSLSLGDWLDDEVPIEWLAEMLDTIRQCSDVDWLLCTKRPELWRPRMEAVAKLTQDHVGFLPAFDNWLNAWIEDEPPANVVIITSVEDQKAADERIPALLGIPAWRRGLSMEPLLGPVDLALNGTIPKDISPRYQHLSNLLHWVIIGGESGTGARVCDVDWIRNIIAQCKAYDVPVFTKQLGKRWLAKIHGDARDFTTMVKDDKGGDITEWPLDLQVREFYHA